MLLVLSDTDEPVVWRVAEELRRRNAPFVMLNPAAERVAPSLRCVFESSRTLLRTSAGEIDLDRISAVWSWRPGLSPDRYGPQSRLVDRAADAYVQHEWVALIGHALGAGRRQWTPAPPSVVRHADGKLGQLALAERLGLGVPPTLITNDANEALAFIGRHDGDVIVKAPSVTLSSHLIDRGLAVFTRALTPRDLAAIEDVVHAPVMLQPRLPKRFELRVTVVGAQAFAAEIHSQVTRRTRVDWRRYDHAHTPVFPHELPDDVAERCVALTHALGLSYGTIDLVLTPDGEYVFLEINPNGQWTWIEALTGLPITAALCDQLTSTTEPDAREHR